MAKELDLFKQQAHARTTDPETSHAAAESIKPDALRATQAAVLDAVRRHGPLTDTRLISVAAVERWKMSPSGLRTRRTELVDRGLVYDTGSRVRLKSGRMSTLWAATE